jgi:hypothetical protein
MQWWYIPLAAIVLYFAYSYFFPKFTAKPVGCSACQDKAKQ